MAEQMFHVGDKVQIRDWDDLAKEYGVGNSCNIPVPFFFTQKMRSLCGEVSIVDEVEKMFIEDTYKLVLKENENGNFGKDYCWHISQEMCVLVEDPPEFSGDDFLALLN